MCFKILTRFHPQIETFFWNAPVTSSQWASHLNLLLLVSCFICMWKPWKNPRSMWLFTSLWCRKEHCLKCMKSFPPQKKLIFSCQAHTTSNHKLDKGIMEETSCLRTAVTFHSHCSPLVPHSRLLPSPWWWLPAPCHGWYKEQDRCSLNVLLQCTVSCQVNPPLLLLAEKQSPCWHKGAWAAIASWQGVRRSSGISSTDMNCHCPSVCRCL